MTILDNLSNSTIIHPKAHFIQEDIRNFSALKESFIGIDGCFHLAAIPTVRSNLNTWLDVHEVNLKGSLNVFNAAILACNIPVVYASSCSVYGDSQTLPSNEAQYVKPISAYGCDKLSTELHAHFLSHEYQLPSMGLRFFNVYGPNQRANSPYASVITKFIQRIINYQPITIFGDGEQTRDFVFVDDIVWNLIHAMQILKQGAHVVNICTGTQTSIHQLINYLTQRLNIPAIKDYQTARDYEAQISYGCKAKMETYNFSINYTLQQGLEKSLEYFLATQKVHYVSPA